MLKVPSFNGLFSSQGHKTSSPSLTHLSSWGIPQWMAMAGKFCSTRRRARAMQRCTDLKRIVTCWVGGGGENEGMWAPRQAALNSLSSQPPLDMALSTRGPRSQPHTQVCRH